jgi:LuxR family maltose regulon positive regulatory protein
LLRQAAVQGIAPAARLLATVSVPPPVPREHRIPSVPFVEPLTEREQEVLRLIADGLSNREIATRLFVAVTTVKKHASNVYGKLGVRSRTEAVARARELGWL